MMERVRSSRWVAVVVTVGALAWAPAARAGACKRVHAELVEQRSTTGCVAPATRCFFGEVVGNHGLVGTTYFAADSSAPGPATSPGSVSYSGGFVYTLAEGSLVMRETGATTAAWVTAFQQVERGSGAFAGVTGYLFVNGLKSADGTVITVEVSGELCWP